MASFDSVRGPFRAQLDLLEQEGGILEIRRLEVRNLPNVLVTIVMCKF
jgi:hypothetical protein